MGQKLENTLGEKRSVQLQAKRKKGDIRNKADRVTE